MTIEQTFLDLPETPTFNVWRIENFKPVPWADVGSFYSGDSYIVLQAVYVGSSQRVARDIYYWIGAKSTQDEYGAAAIKTVELDDRFGGEPTQHRETQYHESAAFVKLFDAYGGVTYLEGGAASGFKAVDRSKGVRLYQVKGRRSPVLLEVPAAAASLNQGDAFILTSDAAIFLWIGATANLKEKQKAAAVVDILKNKFKGVPVTRLEGGETSPAFWALLGGEAPIAAAAGADEEAEVANVRRLFKADGGAFALVAEGAAVTRALLTGGLFVLLRGDVVLVFVGKAAAGAKKTALDLGVKFLAAQGLPSHYSVSVAVEGIESDILTLVFA
jgi:gelsolin